MAFLTISGLPSYEFLRWDALSRYQPRPEIRRVLSLTEETKSILRRRTTDSAYTKEDMRADAIRAGYSYEFLPLLEERAMALHFLDFSIDSPEGLLVASGPSKEEWAAREAEKETLYQEKVFAILEEVSMKALSYHTLSVEVMAEHYSMGPDPRVWRMLTSLVPSEKLGVAQEIGRAIQEEREKEREEEHRREQRELRDRG